MVDRARRWLFALYVISAVFVAVQQGVLAQSNDFRIYRFSAVNLLAGRDLYAAHPDQHLDFYKYSPTFALLFIPLAVLPFAPALLLWSLLNALLLYYALRRLLPERQATVAIALVYLELLLSMQYTQCNGLLTALVVLAFVALERGRQVQAALLVAVDTFIKIFPLAAVALAVCHPRRWRFGLIFVGGCVALVALPLVAVPPSALAAQYRSWRAIETADTLNRGYSLMQYLYMWFGADWPNWPVQLAGTAVLLLPLALGRRCCADAAFRRLFLCSLLVYMVLFNHQSEHATFIIAVTGIAIWYVSSPPSQLRTAIMALTVLVMVLHDVDVVPRWVKTTVFDPYRIKGYPCLAAWLVMQWELLVTTRRSAPGETPRSQTAPAPGTT